ncbi:hypothetical protein H0H87_007481 [Tephrocybe sp. NHM501043]|nr:hypothetical protein H0H87_007481 [Tephrocybe sp. NHM501043]
MLDTSPNLAIVGITIALIAVARCIYARRSLDGRKLPPGPPGLPILGNVLEVPTTHLATYFRRILEEYGGLVSLNLIGFPLILLGNQKVARELLEKHSAKNSTRPIFYYIRQHVDPNNGYWALSEDNESHAIARKLTAGVMADVRAGKTELLQGFEALLNINNLLNDGGKDWWNHMKRYSASVVLSATFGLHSRTGQEKELKALMVNLEESVRLLTPNASILNLFPFLDWIPGPMLWRTTARAFRERENAFYNELVDHALTGKASEMNTWAAAFARKDKPEGDQRELLKQFASAAIETTTISLHMFILACIRYPNFIVAAQRELDIVVGVDRMPSFKDRPFLPYIEAIVREVLRWRPAVRSGVPHQSITSTVIQYQGQEYYIPEGSIIFPVTWAIEHDQSRFEDHDRFEPERFLDADGKLKSNYETSAFGFGRRSQSSSS